MNVPGNFSFDVLRGFQSNPKGERVRKGLAFADGLDSRLKGNGSTRSVYGGGEKGSKGAESSVLAEEILRKFPGLTKEELDRLIRDYDVSTMDAEQLSALAGELMEDGVIPACSDEHGLRQIAVIPEALYGVFLDGDASQLGGFVREVSGASGIMGLSAGGQGFGIPEYGPERLRYEAKLLEQTFKRFEQYYTDDERRRCVELANSMAGFSELVELLAAYKEDTAKKAGTDGLMKIETAGSGKDMTKTAVINGLRVYLLDREVMEAHGYKVELSYFAKTAENWREGERKDTLTAEELDALKQKYDSNTMTRKECIDLFGELVEAGILTVSEAKSIYHGGIPMELNLNGTLQKCTPETEAARARWQRISGGLEASDDLSWKMGYDYFDAWYDLVRVTAAADDPDKAFIHYKKFMGIMEELRGSSGNRKITTS